MLYRVLTDGLKSHFVYRSENSGALDVSSRNIVRGQIEFGNIGRPCFPCFFTSSRAYRKSDLATMLHPYLIAKFSSLLKDLKRVL
jgi:hypothetical protein